MQASSKPLRARYILRWLVVAICLFAVPTAYAADDDEARRKPPTQKTEKLSPKVFEQLTAAQEALEARKPGEALSILDKLEKDKLNDYEKAQIYNFYAAVHYEQDNVDATIQDYINILKLENVPEQLRDNALFRLAQLYFIKEDYQTSIRILDKWMAGSANVSPDAYMLKAQAHYQMEQFEDAKNVTLQALQEARRRNQAPKENWLGLLRAAYYELGEYEPAARLLEILVKLYPKPGYYKQLSGMYGLMEQQKKQLYVMHAAYVAGMLQNESEILNMARLYMAENAPAPAISVLEDAMDKDLVDDEKPDNLQLLAQAMSLAQNYEEQIPVLQKLASTSGEAKHYLYLGQAQVALTRWSDAAASLRQALQGKDLEDRANVQIQLGMALFNSGKLKEAKRVFIDASDSQEVGEDASNWIKFIDSEIRRAQALN